jgi:hypothetical protein
VLVVASKCEKYSRKILHFSELSEGSGGCGTPRKQERKRELIATTDELASWQSPIRSGEQSGGCWRRGHRDAIGVNARSMPNDDRRTITWCLFLGAERIRWRIAVVHAANAMPENATASPTPSRAKASYFKRPADAAESQCDTGPGKAPTLGALTHIRLRCARQSVGTRTARPSGNRPRGRAGSLDKIPRARLDRRRWSNRPATVNSAGRY